MERTISDIGFVTMVNQPFHRPTRRRRRSRPGARARKALAVREAYPPVYSGRAIDFYRAGEPYGSCCGTGSEEEQDASSALPSLEMLDVVMFLWGDVDYVDP
jgi:hypothetical protein